jgi:diguanylate cyclase (GGDEF)-like protein/PAS domain S-box-containing protein
MTYGARTRPEAAGGRAPNNLVDSLPVGVFTAGADHVITFANDAWAATMRTPAERAVGTRLYDLLHDNDRARIAGAFATACTHRQPLRFRASLPGTTTWVEFAIQFVSRPDDEQPGDDYFAGTVHEVTDSVEAVRLAEVLHAVFEATPDLVGITDDRGGVVYANPAARARFGFGDADTHQLSTDTMYTPEAFELYYSEIRPQLLRGEPWAGIVPMRNTDGDVFDVWQTIVAGVGLEMSIEWLVSIGRDTTEVHEVQAELEYRATHDALTGLPNRTLLLDHLHLALGRRNREEHGVGLVFVDLDGFKEVNDRYGHDAGDAVLREVAQRLADVTRPSDTVARYGGDEFVVLLDGLQDGMAEAAQIARRLVDAVAGLPVNFGRRVQITASAGVAVAPRHLDNPDRLIVAADRLMYRAKRAGGNTVVAPFPSREDRG